MASLFIGVLVEKYVKVGNPISDGNVFVFTLLNALEGCKVWSDTDLT